MKSVISILFLIGTSLSFACDEISGVYKTVSESHWNYVITISYDELNVNYSNYWYGEGDGYSYDDERYEVNSNFTGYCQKQGDDYILKFDGKEITFKYDKNQSLEVLGEKGSLPGISGVLFGEYETKLWNFDKKM